MHAKVVNDATGLQLYLYDGDRQIKHKGVIKLYLALLYECNSSLWDRDHCFQIIETRSPFEKTVTYLRALTHDSYQAWIEVLQSVCNHEQHDSRSTPRVRGRRNLMLQVYEAKNLLFTGRKYCSILLDRVRVARTSRNESRTNVVWNEQFELVDIPPHVSSVTFQIDEGEVSFPLDSLKQDAHLVDWYELRPTGDKSEHTYGSLRLSVRYMNDLRLSTSMYGPLQQLLLELPEAMSLGDFVRSYPDVECLAAALLRLFRVNGRETELIVGLCADRIPTDDERRTVVPRSLVTALIDLFVRTECLDYLKATIGETLHRLTKSEQSADLNPSQLDINDDVTKNAKFLRELLDEIALAIFGKLSDCPPSVRFLCNCLQEKAAVDSKKRFSAVDPDVEVRRRSAVAEFMFQRLICPALKFPQQFELSNKRLDSRAYRSATMIAKCLEQLATLRKFDSVKEPYMSLMNPFIVDNRQCMLDFLNNLPLKVAPNTVQSQEDICMYSMFALPSSTMILILISCRRLYGQSVQHMHGKLA
ncbi:hypothetical protein KR222_005373 [Zaprionus bogoriensis]|nr:hypothetical protein KR222_005373 [Zaprionus bogoriensis]